MPSRRIPRVQTRAEHWAEQLAAASSGEEALVLAVRWIRSELSRLAESRPPAAEAARWELARQLAAYASRLPRAKITLRTGLTVRERWQLLHPWTPPEEGPR